MPLNDTLPIFNANAGTSAIASLSIGAVGIGAGVLLAGTGDPNDASDSYYGEGILRSADGGSTWTLSQGSLDGVAGNHSFTGLSVAGFAFSTVNPSLMVAALSEAAEGVLVNAPDATNSVKGLYVSSDAGLTWQMAVILDGSQTVQTPQPTGGNAGGNAATAVVWNPLRQRFYAAVRYHGYYESADGATWTRLAHQPGAGLTTTACPTDPGSTGNVHCPIYRGALAVQPVSGDLFALTVDASNLDQGLYQDLCASNGGACASNTVSFATALPSAPLEVGNGSSTILQGDYNLTLAASPLGADTVVYAGTIDLYRCTLAGGCTLRNTTNAQNGCLNPAGVGAAQHAVSTLAGAGAPLVYLGNDSGLWRSADGIAQTGTACSMADAAHFQNLNGGLGSLAEIVSFAQDPTSTSTLLAGLGALGTAGTGSSASAWPQLATGEGGTVAIDPATPSNWYLSNGAGVSIGRCGSGANCVAADFTPNVIGEAQVANDLAAIHAPWLLDPAFSANLLVGTCRAWRGPASNGALWSSSNSLSRPFGTPAATACASTAPVVRSLAPGGAVSNSTNAQSAGSKVLYAGLAGTLDGGQGFGGHLFATFAADLATSQTVWSDLTASPVTNDVADSGVFNPGGFDVSSIAADPHDATGRTVYATVMGFAGNRVNAPHLYRSIDGGAHWSNISSNLPNAPANSVIVDPNDANTLYVGLDTGLYVTTGVANCTTANCWSVFGSGLPNAPVVELQAAPSMPTGDGRTGMLRAATYGRGIWQTPLLTAVASAVPVMAINPAALSFQSQQIGTQSAAIPVTVTNVGNAPLTVSSVAMTGDFTETDSCVGPAIAQGSSCTVSVIFVPTATGARTGLLTVYGDVVGGQATASLTGTGTPASTVVLTPTTLNFVPTSLGATSLPGFITLSNLGTRTVALAVPATSGDFKITANTCGSSLAPDTGCTIGVAFAPTASGTRTGTLTTVDDVGTQVASLIGTGTAPATDTLSPLALSFPGQVLNTTSPLQAITLTNSGDVPLTLIAAQITSGDFTVVNGCGNSLTGHASCTLSVAYVPKAVGLEAGVLTISDQYRAQAVQLAGFGLAPAGVSLSPLGGLSFGAVGLGIPAAPQTLLLTNNGGTTLAIDAISVTGDFFLVAGTNTCGVSLAPSAVCTVQIGFTPTLPGVRTGLVSFLDSALNSPQTSSLTGTGVDFTLLPDGPTSMSITSGQKRHLRPAAQLCHRSPRYSPVHLRRSPGAHPLHRQPRQRGAGRDHPGHRHRRHRPGDGQTRAAPRPRHPEPRMGRPAPAPRRPCLAPAQIARRPRRSSPGSGQWLQRRPRDPRRRHHPDLHPHPNPQRQLHPRRRRRERRPRATGQSLLDGEITLGNLPRGKSGGPRPLKVEPAQPARHVDHLADEVKPWNLPAFERPRIQLSRVHAPRGHLRLHIPLGPRRRDGPGMNLPFKARQNRIRQRALPSRQGAVSHLEMTLQQPFGPARRQHRLEHRQRRRRIPACPRSQQRSKQVRPGRRKVDRDRLTRPPIRRDLQNRGAAQPAVRNQQLLAKGRGRAPSALRPRTPRCGPCDHLGRGRPPDRTTRRVQPARR